MIKLDWRLGACVDEADVKKKFRKLYVTQNPKAKLFQIENEGEEPGMPDLLLIEGLQYEMMETKYTEDRIVSFKPTQIRWYRRHPTLVITVVVYRRKDETCYLVRPEEVRKLTSTILYLPKELIS